MEDPHAGRLRRLEESLLDGPGELPPGTRRSIADMADMADPAGTAGGVPEVLLPYLDQVLHRAYTVTDEDVEALRRTGVTEDQIFEATVAAAFGAGLRRIQAGLAALGAEED